MKPEYKNDAANIANTNQIPQADTKTKSVQNKEINQIPHKAAANETIFDVNHELMAALVYRRMGWYIFPVHSVDDKGDCTCGKCGKEGRAAKHPVTEHGLNEASIDPNQINEWFGNRSIHRRNIGIRTGIKSGITVIDVDIAEGKLGAETWATLIEGHGEPDTLMAETGSGGMHFVFKYSSSLPTGTNVLGENIDVRNDGGYIIVEPSLHKSGGSYSWITDFNADLAYLPAYLSHKVEKHVKKHPNSKANDSKRPSYTLDEVESMLEVIPSDDRTIWRSIGIILGRVFGDSDEDSAWELYNEWSDKWGGKKDNMHDKIMHEAFYVLSKKGSENELSIGTIVKLAKDHGWIDENYHFDDVNGWMPGKKKPFSMDNFLLNNNLDEMRKKMLEDKFVLGNLAIFGQATVFYAPPNAGKTLITIRLLIDSIKSCAVDGKDVYYINADDSYKGLIHKLELANKYGFGMLAPGHNEFESKQFLLYLRAMINEDTARGKIIILDTLKKFTELMDKKSASDFMKTGREFISNGGTLIFLAHTNKRRDEDGKGIFGGTSDIVDDADCAYIINPAKTAPGDTTKTVIFDNIKSRGNCTRSIGYKYSLDVNYDDLLESVSVIDENEIETAKKHSAYIEKIEKDLMIIESVIEAIGMGIVLKGDITKFVMDDTGKSRSKIWDVLKYYEGEDATMHKWILVKGDKNEKKYQILDVF
ncbi:MAG: bifunctional DNA primase/polymerase [Methylococcaceae bacterium]|jgi:hypothetical protein